MATRTLGRPRKAGPRHPSGQLVQKAEPNAKVVAIRRALLGEGPGLRLADAEHPMALALARGWISPEQHRAGESYARAWRRSHPQRRTPGLKPEEDGEMVAGVTYDPLRDEMFVAEKGMIKFTFRHPAKVHSVEPETACPMIGGSRPKPDV